MIELINQSGPDVQVGTGVGVAIFVFALAAVWGSIHLREKTYEDWSDKTDLTYVGLEDRATDILGALRTAIDEVTPHAGLRFDPTSVVTDLAPVGKLAKKAVRVLKERMRIHKQFDVVKKLCTALKWVAVAFALTTLTWTLLYSFFFEETLLWVSIAIFGATVFVAGAVLALLYTVFRGRLQQSYEHSRPSSDREEG